MEHIVLGYDASEAARSALEWVAARAARRPLEVTLVVIADMFDAERPVIRAQQDEATQRLRELAPGLRVDTRMWDGLMPGAVVTVARDADLLVIGVHSGRRLRAFLNGAIPLRVSARSEVPVCLVPAGWDGRDGAVAIGLSNDGSSDAALAFALREAAASGRVLRIVHAWLMTAPGSPSANAAGHRARLDAAVAAIARSHPDLVVEAVLVRDNPAAALSAATARDALLVIGSHHRGVLSGGFLGSVAWDLIGQLGRPICVVPPVAATNGVSATDTTPGARSISW
jgi:nucleotide-binding universal stress UspA family protein